MTTHAYTGSVTIVTTPLLPFLFHFNLALLNRSIQTLRKNLAQANLAQHFDRDFAQDGDVQLGFGEGSDVA
jgi:hypothetical protein